MRDVTRVFQERKAEINLYFNFIEEIMLNNAHLGFPDETKRNIDGSLSKILRANGFLLLYNIVEYSMTQGIEAVYLHLINNDVDYDSINLNIKKEILSNIKSNIGIEKIVLELNSIASDIIKQYPRKIFSGNIDAKKVKEVSEKYGFSCQTDYRSTKNGEKLLTVKSQRNALAHGDLSFQDCGQEYTIQDMITIKNEVLNYLDEILNNIEVFLSEQKYLAA